MVSIFRLYLLRAAYLLVFLFLSTSIWPTVVRHASSKSLMHGVALCLLAAMAPLVLLGLRYPLKMLPILLFELIWKTLWLLTVGLPLWSSQRADAGVMETLEACVFGLILFPLVIPWRYVFEQYVKAPGDRWRRARGR